MMRASLAALVALLISSPALAWEEPARGTPLRADMLDAIRPHLEWNLGAPVEIVVQALRVQGDRGFVAAYAQRPGGAPVDLARTPMARRGDYHPDISDGSTIQALLQRSGRMWVAVHHAIGATDVWYSDPELCRDWRVVLGDACP
jgi:hypothetical protein